MRGGSSSASCVLGGRSTDDPDGGKEKKDKKDKKLRDRGKSRPSNVASCRGSHVAGKAKSKHGLTKMESASCVMGGVSGKHDGARKSRHDCNRSKIEKIDEKRREK